MGEAVERLLNSKEPTVRLKVLQHVLTGDPASSEIRRVQEEVRSSSRVSTLLSERDSSGRIPFRPYSKWRGTHWVLATLADMGYPPGDPHLIPLRDQVLEWLFSEKHERKIRSIDGRVRRCASQEGNALYSLLSLGLADERCDELASRLTKWQWLDGGWNCDKKPQAKNSSFMKSLIPLRALALYAKLKRSNEARDAAERVTEVFLKRRLYKRQRDGQTIKREFLELHYPCYWHYDILFALKVMAEAGFINDERCSDALDLLESKRLPDGGFPAEKRYYHVNPDSRSGISLVDWGGVDKKYMNEFVTVDALHVLKSFNRLKT